MLFSYRHQPLLFIPKARTCWLRAMISPGCFCPGSGNDPLKKQLVQHLEKEEQASIENKIQERNSFTPLTCQGPAQTPGHAPLHHRRPQLSSPATPLVALLLPRGGGAHALGEAGDSGCMLTGDGGGKKVPGSTSDLNKHKHIKCHS